MSTNNYLTRVDCDLVVMETVFRERKPIFLKKKAKESGLGGQIQKLVIHKKQRKNWVQSLEKQFSITPSRFG